MTIKMRLDRAKNTRDRKTSIAWIRSPGASQRATGQILLLTLALGRAGGDPPAGAWLFPVEPLPPNPRRAPNGEMASGSGAPWTSALNPMLDCDPGYFYHYPGDFIAIPGERTKLELHVLKVCDLGFVTRKPGETADRASRPSFREDSPASQAPERCG
jgi:hypothetical protein